MEAFQGQDLTSLGEMGQGSLPLLTVTKEALSGELRDLPAGAVNNEQGENK